MECIKFFRGVLGFFLAAIIINSLWGVFINSFGIFGGYVAAFVLTGSMWTLNHYLGLIPNDKDSAFIDMGLGIAISLAFRDSIIHGINSVVTSIPTFLCITIGAVLGGYVAGVVELNAVKANKNYDALEIINTKTRV